MSEDTSRKILSPESMPVYVVVIGALALLAVSMNFYNWSLIQSVTGASLALQQDAMNDARSGDSARIDALEKDLAATKTALTEAQHKLSEMSAVATAAGEGMDAGGPK